MKIHEYQAKEIFSKYGIPVERHTLCRTAAGAVAAYRRMGSDKVVIKAQVLTGGRGKAGGVKLVDNTEDTYQEARNILGMSLKGFLSIRYWSARRLILPQSTMSALPLTETHARSSL